MINLDNIMDYKYRFFVIVNIGWREYNLYKNDYIYLKDEEGSPNKGSEDEEDGALNPVLINGDI